jgi:DNA replication protein DnaC
LNKGYGLLVLGNNGSGKTMFSSYILRQAILKGRYAYYTTSAQLVHDLKLGWKDEETSKCLEKLMASDFVVIDELGKELGGGSVDTFSTSEIERFLKSRFDDSMPTILASNRSMGELESCYGKTFVSMVQGKYQIVDLGNKDYRLEVGKQMLSEMRYDEV